RPLFRASGTCANVALVVRPGPPGGWGGNDMQRIRPALGHLVTLSPCHLVTLSLLEGSVDTADLRYEALKREWTDQYVEVNPERPELKRFEGIVGRVVTVNHNNKALVDFQDGGWYDITASADYLRKLD